MITTLLFIATFCIPQTPESWQDPRLDSADVEAMAELISFSPPILPSNVVWVNTDKETPKTWDAFLGKVVVVQSWTNATPAGRQAFSTITKMITKLDQNEEVILVTLHTPEKINTAHTFVTKSKLRPQTILDTSGKICNSLGFYKDPTNIIIDRNGAVQHVGLRPSGVQKAIKKLLETPFNSDKKTKPFVFIDKKTSSSAIYPAHSSSFGRATNMQGKPAPKFFVQEWITPEPPKSNRVRVVEFWATWCPPCRKSIPHLNKLTKHFKNKVSFIGVSAETQQKVTAFIAKMPMEYGVAIDATKQMQTAISCSAIPLALVISYDNIVRWQGNPSKLTKQIIQQIIDADKQSPVPKKRGKWDPLLNNG